MNRIECPRCTDIGFKNLELKTTIEEIGKTKGAIYEVECLNCYEKFEIIMDFENCSWEYYLK